MPTLELPPRGVFVAVSLIYNAAIPASAFQTWVQLRGLAWREGITPPFSLIELSQLTGKSLSTLYSHLALLRSCGALDWRPTETGLMIVAF